MTSALLDLPVELLVETFNRLKMKDIISLRNVHPYFRSIVKLIKCTDEIFGPKTERDFYDEYRLLYGFVNYKFNKYVAWPFVILVFICFLSKLASQVTMYYYDPASTDNDNIMFPMYTTGSVLMFICSLILVILLAIQLKI